MKKTILIAAFLTASFSQAQTLLTDNFNSLTVGNVSTDITGATAGQGGFYTDATGGAVTNFQIVDEGGAYGNVVQITGSATATGTRYLFREGLDTAWDGRTTGNDIIEVEYEFYTGAASTSKNTARVLLYNSDYTKVLGGLSMAMDTKVISGLSYYDNSAVAGGSIANYSFNLAATPLVLPASTWVKVGFSFNSSTGEVLFRGPGFNGGVDGAAAGEDPFEIDYITTAGTGNTVAGVAKFDNLVSRASATDTLLGVETITRANAFSVYPNPVKNFVNVSSEDYTVNSVQIADMNGRIVKTVSNNSNQAQVDLSELSQGIYMMTITSSEGISSTKKIVKQ